MLGEFTLRGDRHRFGVGIAIVVWVGRWAFFPFQWLVGRALRAGGLASLRAIGTVIFPRRIILLGVILRPNVLCDVAFGGLYHHHALAFWAS